MGSTCSKSRRRPIQRHLLMPRMSTLYSCMQRGKICICAVLGRWCVILTKNNVYNFVFFLLKEILYKKQCKFCVLRTRLISNSRYFVFCNSPSEGIPQKFIFVGNTLRAMFYFTLKLSKHYTRKTWREGLTNVLYFHEKTIYWLTDVH